MHITNDMVMCNVINYLVYDYMNFLEMKDPSLFDGISIVL